MKNLVYENGMYWVQTAEFGTGRLRPKSKGYEVMRLVASHGEVAGSYGDGPQYLAMAIARCDELAAKFPIPR